MQLQVDYGKNKILVQIPSKRKTIDNLIKLTRNLTDEKLQQINEELQSSNTTGSITESSK